jgi:hypothetical protein
VRAKPGVDLAGLTRQIAAVTPNVEVATNAAMRWRTQFYWLLLTGTGPCVGGNEG